MNNTNPISDSKPIMSGDWSRAFVDLNSRQNNEITKMRKLHKWMHLVLPERVVAKLILKNK